MRIGAAATTVALVVLLPVAGPTAAQEPASRDGSCTATWQDTGVPDNGTSDQVLNAITGTSPSDLYAVGRHRTPASYTGRALRNTGSGWSDLSLPPLSGFAQLTNATSAGPGNAWFGGFESHPSRDFAPVLLHAVGSTVTRVPLPEPPASTSACNSDDTLPLDSPGGDDLAAAATYWTTDFSGTRSMLYRRLAGGGWAQTPVPMSDVTSVDAVTATSGYVGGIGLYQYLGGAVTQVTFAGVPKFIRGIDSRSASDVWALGDNGSSGLALLHFDGTSWSSVPVEAPTASGAATGMTISVAPNGVVWLLGTVPDGGFHQSWTGRYDPSTGTWASVVSSVGGQAPGTGYGAVVGLHALSGQHVYAAGWSRSQAVPLVGRLCQLTAGPRALTPSSVRLNRLGDGLLVTAGQAVTGSVTVRDVTGATTTGSLVPQQGGALRFYAAGTYRMRTEPSGGSATVAVPLRIRSGIPFARSVTVDVATRTVPAGYAYRLQVLAPAAASWRTVSLDSRFDGTSRTFAARGWPAGTYSVRARLVNTRAGTGTGWSPAAQFVLPAGR
jgi:hypothetical protein